MQQWSEIFSNPVKLGATATKNWYLHQRKINDLIADESDDWANDQWFQAGIDIADLFITVVGPVETDPSLFGFTDDAIPDFVAGFIYGFTGDNQLDNIEGCFDGSTGIYINVREGIDNIHEDGATWVDYTEAAINFGGAALLLPDSLSHCKHLGKDISEIEDWAQIFMPENRTQLIKTLTRNWAFHRKAIDADLVAVKTDWINEDYFDAGVAAADGLTIATGGV